MNLSSVATLVLFSILIFFPFIGEINLFDWHETLIASVSKEMYLNKIFWTPLIDGHYYLDSPPLFFDMQQILYKYLGINEYTSRLPNAICGFMTVLSIYKIGRRIYSNVFGLLWSLIYISMFLSQFYHKSGLIEPWFNFLVFVSVYNMSRVLEMIQERSEGYYLRSDIIRNLNWSALACAGAMLVNGLEAFALVILSYWFSFFVSSGRYGLGYFNIIRWLIIIGLIIGFWVFMTITSTGSTDFIVKFWNYQIQQMTQTKTHFLKQLAFHIIVLLLGCFPASIFAMGSFQRQSYEPTIQRVFRLLMIGLLLATLLIATMIKIKIVHYSSLAYFPISFLAAYTTYFLSKKETKLAPKYFFAIAIVGGFWAFLLMIVPISQVLTKWIFPLLEDPILQEVLSQQYPWQWYEVSFGIVFFIMLLVSLFLFGIRRNKSAISLLFFTTLFISQVVLVYYVPKIEALVQGSMIEFVKQITDTNPYIKHYKHTTYIPQFYSQVSRDTSAPPTYYMIASTSDSFEFDTLSRHYNRMYKQGIYTFYKKK